jgi:hypothetical protein
MIRWLSDRFVRKKYSGMNLTEEQLTAEADKSPGVLMASGYIAGGAIAGIFYALMQGFNEKVPWVTRLNGKIDKAAEVNRFVNGPHADLLSCIPFVILIALLYLVGREMLLAPKARKA